MSNDVDRVRNAVDIVALVSRTIKLRKAGKNFTGLCPFHEDTKPSLTVSPEIQRYRCWACGAQGDAFDWLMNLEKMTFPEALKDLAASHNITLEGRGRKDRSEAEQFDEIMKATQEFFRDQLESAPKVVEYCEGRGFDANLRKEWGIGYAPNVSEALTVHLKKKGFRLAEAAKLWVVDEKQGGFGDRFRDRLMFPIRNERGRLVGYGGRALGEYGPKYLNSGDTPIFYKSGLLYGMEKAAATISDRDEAVMCEGYTDVIACHRAGVTNAVATLGTSCTEKHALLLKRWCNRVVLLYDGDTAGQKAAERASGILSTHDIEVRLALISGGADPDTVLKEKGPEHVVRMVADAKPVVLARLDLLASRLKPADSQFWSEAISVLRAEKDPLLREQGIDWLAPKHPTISQHGAAADAIRAKIQRSGRASRPAPRAGATEPRPKTDFQAGSARLLNAERAVLVSLSDDKIKEQAWGVIEENIFESQPARQIGAYLLKRFDSAPKGEIKDWLGQIEDTDVKNWLTDVSLNERIGNRPEAYLEEAAKFLRQQAFRRQAESQLRSGQIDPRETHDLYKKASTSASHRRKDPR